MKKKIVTLICALITVLSSIIMAFPVSAVPQEYWAIQARYSKAVEEKNDDAVIEAVESLSALFNSPTDPSECNMLAWPLQKAAAIYEKRGQFKKAAETYSTFLDCVEILDKNGYDYYDLIKTTEALIRHNSMVPTVYTKTSETVSYSGAIYEPECGTYFGSCAFERNSSAYLLYANFPDENFENFGYLLEDADYAKIIELAWNLKNESFSTLAEIASGKYDNYIISNLKYISTIDTPVLLRLFAEANCWTDLSTEKSGNDSRKADAETYVSAFRHVSSMARKYAPNAAIVFSPNDISNWYVSFEDFYPGDDYVDWVGMSSYMNRNPGAQELGNGADAVYSRGLYDSQIAKIKPIVDLFGDRKPIMISECGFLFKGDNQTVSYASEKMKDFYSYVNMVYPQVKAVFYFRSGNYVFDGNKTITDTYNAATHGNAPLMSSLDDEMLSYCKLSDYGEKTDALHLYTYADCPGNAAKKVTYSINGKSISSTNSVPYDCTITPTSLKSGKNTLSVTITLGADSYKYDYTLNLIDGKISVSEYTPIEFPSSWAEDEVNAAIEAGLVPEALQANYTKGISRANITRILVKLIAKKSGITESDFLASNNASGQFTDTNDSYISSIAEIGIVKGNKQTDGTYTFNPGDTLKRSEIAVIVNRVADYFGIETSGFENEVNFKDTVDHWCKPELGWPVHMEIVNGMSKTEFSPDDTLTTEQAILIVYRLYKAIK